jgi:hypothetical protein
MRIKRQYPELELVDRYYADKQMLAYAVDMWSDLGISHRHWWCGDDESQLMSVFERAALNQFRAMGWSGFRVLIAILGGSLIVCLVEAYWVLE